MIEPLAPIESKPRRNTCKNCKWWDVSEYWTQHFASDSNDVNECHGGPPLPYHGRTFPKTRADDWCRNHEEYSPYVETLFQSKQDSPVIGLAPDDANDEDENE